MVRFNEWKFSTLSLDGEKDSGVVLTESSLPPSHLLDLGRLNTHLHANLDRCLGIVDIGQVIDHHVRADRHIDARHHEIVQDVYVAAHAETRAE